MVSRRHFIQSAGAVGLALPGLAALTGCAQGPSAAGLGLAADPEGMLDLAPGFTYSVLSRTGDEMSDGLLEPGAHDGMACFPVEGDADRCILVRNHELDWNEDGERGAFGERFARAGGVDKAKVYDWAGEAQPFLGGTTTALVNLRSGRIERTHMSLIGTSRNCAGGPTPWGSWLTCEETDERAGARGGKDHGYVFEVPASATEPVEPVPLEAMGRFVHEAAAVDPATGIVYMTEDRGDGLFYRFLPTTPGVLRQGGRLQALAIRGQAGADLTNHPDASDRVVRAAPGQSFEVDWVTLDDYRAPNGDLHLQGRGLGAAIFARGEGMAFAIVNGRPAIYFACTSGGAAKKGQIWRYVPSENEGLPYERGGPGKLELFVESSGEAHFDYADNIVASPGGDIIMCEDGGGDNYLRGVTRSGNVYSIARNALPGQSEMCGACFSPDGGTLFVNIQKPGITLAIRGDWAGLSVAADIAADIAAG